MRTKPSSKRRRTSIVSFLGLFVSLVLVVGFLLSVYRLSKIKKAIRGTSSVRSNSPSFEAMHLFNGTYIDGEEISSGKGLFSIQECSQLCMNYTECNAFSVCLLKSKCKGDTFGLCTLKNVFDVTRLQLDTSGPDVGWTSSVFPPSLSQLESLFQARGLTLLTTDTFIVGLRNTTGTVEVITPRSNPFFSFTLPFDNFARKSDLPGHHRLGDLSFHLRKAVGGDSQFTRFGTVADRGRWQQGPKLSALSIKVNDGGKRMHVDLSDEIFLHRGPDLSKALQVERWIETPGLDDHPWNMPGEVRLMFSLTNLRQESVEIGALGLSMVMDQFFVNRKLEQVAVQCSFIEAYVGGGFGYIQVTRANGEGPTLLILPIPGTSFEAWRPLRGDDRTEGVGFGFEGHQEVLLHSKSWAEDEWKAAKPWVNPSSKTLAKGEQYTFGFRMILAPCPTKVEATLRAAGQPVIIGVPGFVLHHDMRESRLIVQLPEQTKSGSMSVESIVIEPPIAVEIDPAQPFVPPHLKASFQSSDFNAHYRIRGLSNKPRNETSSWSKCKSDEPLIPDDCPGFVGRVRIRFIFHIKQSTGASTPRELVAQLNLLPPARDQVSLYGRASSDPTRGWLAADSGDPWQRGPSFMGLDNEEGGEAGLVKLMAEQRVFMSGLSDEAGAAQPLAMAIKQTVMPVQDEIEKLESYVHQVLCPEDEAKRPGIQSPLNFSVRASMFYYDPNNSFVRDFEKAQPSFMQGCSKSAWWLTCWTKARSSETWRAYNYPHVAAVYWSLYRLSRFHHPPLTRMAEWAFYLKRAAKTALAMYEFGPGYGRWGLMVGSVFASILDDLENEGWNKEASKLKQVMGKRIEFWQSLTFPFGSEMAWDNTGHEEIYTWLHRVGDKAGSLSTVQAILAYDGLFPHWALSGSARRWWDFFINGKTNIGNERVYHHYAATLNSVPIWAHAISSAPNVDRLFFIRLATAGVMGSLTNIKPNGGSSMGFHGDPSLLRLDGYSADFGIGFFGHAKNAGSALHCDSDLGCLCFYCDATFAHDGLQFKPMDAFRKRAHLLPLGLSIQAFSASISNVLWDYTRRTVSVMMDQDELYPQNSTLVQILHSSEVTGIKCEVFLSPNKYEPCKKQMVGSSAYFMIDFYPYPELRVTLVVTVV